MSTSHREIVTTKLSKEEIEVCNISLVIYTLERGIQTQNNQAS